MDWTKAVRDAVDFMEKHMTEEITMEDVAAHVNMSPFYFHGQLHQGIHPVPRTCAVDRAQGQDHAQSFRTAEIINLIERWLCDGLQDHKKGSVYSAGGVKRV